MRHCGFHAVLCRFLGSILCIEEASFYDVKAIWQGARDLGDNYNFG